MYRRIEEGTTTVRDAVLFVLVVVLAVALSLAAGYAIGTWGTLFGGF